MSWVDRRNLRGGASFRGVPFYVDAIAKEQGRRTVVHRFPGREEVLVQDLGLDAERFRVQAYVIGPDYDTDLARLEEALLAGGPGQLVHPWRGRFDVEIVGPIQTQESKREGGMALVSFEAIVLPDDLRLPPTRRDTRARVDLDASAFRDAASAEFVAAFSTASLPDELVASSLSVLDQATQHLAALNSSAHHYIGAVNEVAADIAEFTQEAASLIRAPARMADALAGVVANAYAAVASVRGAVLGTVYRVTRMLTDEALSMRDFGGDLAPIPTPTAQRQQEADNRDAMLQFFRGLAAAELSRAIAGAPFASFSRARAARDAVAELLDSVSYGAGDESYEALSALRASIVEHLDEVAAGLPELAIYTPAQELPALLIAHLLYGDARREAEIVERNDPPHPGLISHPLEVLNA